MRNLFALVFSMLLAVLPAQAQVDRPTVPKTVFHYAEGAWAVGQMNLGRPLKFREGRILVFPCQITDLLWAPEQTKPRNLMLVVDVSGDAKDSRFVGEGDQIFGPIRLLPDHSYWRDNLPNTRRHEIPGGRRYYFRGDQIPEVRKVLGDYLAAHDRKGLERWSGQIQAVATALGSSVQVLREDAVSYLASYPDLARHLPQDALPPIRAHLLGDAPVEEKAALITALVDAKAAGIQPLLQDLSARDDASGALALKALDILGSPADDARLMVLVHAKAVEVRGYAASALGRRAGTEEADFAKARELLESTTEDPAVRQAAAEGLGASKSPKAADVLASAVRRGDDASRAAALGLAASGLPEAADLLAAILKESDGEPATAAAAALSQMSDCATCVGVLRDQHENHKSEAVRGLIGVILEVPLVHKH